VSHDINADPEMWELTDRCGDRALRVWLECLSIADRNSGKIGKDGPQLYKVIATKCRLRSNKVATILQLSRNLVWTKLDDCGCLHVVKWPKYNKTRVANNFPSYPNLSSPNHPNKNKPPKSPKGDIVYSLDFQKAWEINGYGSKLKAWDAWCSANCHTVVDRQLLVMRGLEAEVQWRAAAAKYKAEMDHSYFIPAWKHLATWINQKCWEQNFPPIPQGSLDLPGPSKTSEQWAAELKAKYGEKR